MQGSSNSHNFSGGYNTQEGPTSTRYNMFFIKLHLDRRLQSSRNL